MNAVFESIRDRWMLTATKQSASGWISRNAVCCEHRGESYDKRGRGGLIIQDDTLRYHCFNCSFTAKYVTGTGFFPKMVRLLRWIGFTEEEINQLRYFDLQLRDNLPEGTSIAPKRHQVLPTVDIPEAQLITDAPAFIKYRHYLETRGFGVDAYHFFASTAPLLQDKVVIPFLQTIGEEIHCVGYTGRTILDGERRWTTRGEPKKYVFGLDLVLPSYTWFVVSEGIFDALSVHGVATLGATISEEQGDIIDSLKKRVVVVPDLDKAGVSNVKESLINTAVDYGWEVAFPEWDCKDLNEAYQKYGELFVTKHILDSAIENPTKIKVKQKLLLNRFASKDK